MLAIIGISSFHADITFLHSFLKIVALLSLSLSLLINIQHGLFHDHYEPKIFFSDFGLESVPTIYIRKVVELDVIENVTFGLGLPLSVQLFLSR